MSSPIRKNERRTRFNEDENNYNNFTQPGLPLTISFAEDDQKRLLTTPMAPVTMTDMDDGSMRYDKHLDKCDKFTTLLRN
jgi:hypothetical protein